MPKERIGTIEWKGDHWAVRVTICSKPLVRPWFHCHPSIGEAEARAVAKAHADMVKAGTLPFLQNLHLGSCPKNITIPLAVRSGESEVVGGTGELVWEYIDRWIKSRQNLSSVSDDESRMRCWVVPVIGQKPIVAVTRDDLRGLVEKLDQAVKDGKIAWRTAKHVWELVHKMFHDTVASKIKALRVREDGANPADGVEPPDRGVRKIKTLLYPDEFLKFARCEAIDLEWRRAAAIMTYQHLRPGELEVLDWEDLDLEHISMHVHKAVDSKAGNRRQGAKAKPTKTKEARRRLIRAEPVAAPLCDARGGEAARRGQGVRAPGEVQGPHQTGRVAEDVSRGGECGAC